MDIIICKYNFSFFFSSVFTHFRRKYVGFIQFFFKHIQDGVERFLVYIELPKSIKACDYDKSIAVVELYEEEEVEKQYIVVDVKNICCQVGLVVAPEGKNLYKVITPYSMLL